MTMPREPEPPTKGILPSRFKVIDYVQDKIVMLWDMGDIINPKERPDVWLAMEYWDEETRQKAKTRLAFVTGMLNGARPYHEVADIR